MCKITILSFFEFLHSRLRESHTHLPQVGSWSPHVRDDGWSTPVRGGQRGRSLRVDPPRRRPLPGVAEQGGGLHPQRFHAEESQQEARLCLGERHLLLPIENSSDVRLFL